MRPSTSSESPQATCQTLKSKKPKVKKTYLFSAMVTTSAIRATSTASWASSSSSSPTQRTVTCSSPTLWRCSRPSSRKVSANTNRTSFSTSSPKRTLWLWVVKGSSCLMREDARMFSGRSCATRMSLIALVWALRASGASRCYSWMSMLNTDTSITTQRQVLLKWSTSCTSRSWLELKLFGILRSRAQT